MKARAENIQSLLNESLPISQLAFVALHGKGSLVSLLTSPGALPEELGSCVSWDLGFGKAAPVREAINAALGLSVIGTSLCVLGCCRGVLVCPLERSLCTPCGCELQSWALPTQTLPTLLAVTRHTWARTWGRGYGTGPYTKGAVPGFYEHQGMVNVSNLLLFEHPNYKPVSFCYLLSNGCAELFIKHMQNLSHVLLGSHVGQGDVFTFSLIRPRGCAHDKERRGEKRRSRPPSS